MDYRDKAKALGLDIVEDDHHIGFEYEGENLIRFSTLGVSKAILDLWLDAYRMGYKHAEEECLDILEARHARHAARLARLERDLEEAAETIDYECYHRR